MEEELKKLIFMVGMVDVSRRTGATLEEVLVDFKDFCDAIDEKMEKEGLTEDEAIDALNWDFDKLNKN